MTEPQQPAIGVVHNGHVWDGTRWNPAPSQAQQWPPPGNGDGAYVVMPNAFADPHYAYGLTRRAAQDIHFLARFAVVLAWIWMIGVALSVIFGILSLAGLIATVQTVTHFPR